MKASKPQTAPKSQHLQRLDWNGPETSVIDLAQSAFGVPADQATSVFDERPWQERKGQMLAAAVEIQGKRPSSTDLLYLAPDLAMVALPRHETGLGKFNRISGQIELSLCLNGDTTAGLNLECGPHVPQGSFARSVLVAACTWARRSSGELDGSSYVIEEMLACVGLDPTDSNKRQLAEQLHRLIRTNVSMRVFTSEFSGSLVSMRTAVPESTASAMSVTLHEALLPQLAWRPVPLDRRALVALHGSPLATDVYCWLSKVLPWLKKSMPFNLTLLRRQFGDGSSGSLDDATFVPSLLAAVRDALTVYPKARVLVQRGCLILLTSPPPVDVVGDSSLI